MTRRLVDAANTAGARFGYPSSDWVFDGTGRGVDEEEPVNPLNLYGLFKARTRRSPTSPAR